MVNTTEEAKLKALLTGDEVLEIKTPHGVICLTESGITEHFKLGMDYERKKNAYRKTLRNI